MSVTTLFATVVSSAGYATGGELEVPLGRIAIALLFCLALAILAIGLIRRRNGLSQAPGLLAERLGLQAGTSGGHEKLRIVQRLPVMPSGQIVQLEYAGRSYLLYLTSHGATIIDSKDELSQRNTD